MPLRRVDESTCNIPVEMTAKPAPQRLKESQDRMARRKTEKAAQALKIQRSVPTQIVDLKATKVETMITKVPWELLIQALPSDAAIMQMRSKFTEEERDYINQNLFKVGMHERKRRYDEMYAEHFKPGDYRNRYAIWKFNQKEELMKLSKSNYGRQLTAADIRHLIISRLGAIWFYAAKILMELSKEKWNNQWVNLDPYGYGESDESDDDEASGGDTDDEEDHATIFVNPAVSSDETDTIVEIMREDARQRRLRAKREKIPYVQNKLLHWEGECYSIASMYAACTDDYFEDILDAMLDCAKLIVFDKKHPLFQGVLSDIDKKFANDPQLYMGYDAKETFFQMGVEINPEIAKAAPAFMKILFKTIYHSVQFSRIH